jgi:hypothetical protein
MGELQSPTVPLPASSNHDLRSASKPKEKNPSENVVF